MNLPGIIFFSQPKSGIQRSLPRVLVAFSNLKSWGERVMGMVWKKLQLGREAVDIISLQQVIVLE